MDDEEALSEEYEQGWEALRGLAGRVTRRLEWLQSRPDYTAVSPWVMVRVDPCPFCADGGLRMAGFVTRANRLLPVCQCDTCGAVGIGASFYPGKLGPAGIEFDSDLEDDADGDDDDRDWRHYG